MASRSWNRVELIGNLTRDVELRYTPSGAAVATFSVATNRTYVTDGEKKEDVDFHRCVAWNKLAELCSQLLKKGTKVFVSGRLQNRSWEQDGTTKYMTEIVLEDMIILTNKGTGEEYSEHSAPADEDVAQRPETKAQSAKEEPKASKDSEEPEKEKPKDEEPPSENPDIDDLPF